MDRVDMPPLGGDQNRGPVVIAVLSIFFGLSTIIVFLRVVTRICITRNFGWDDATMALTQAINAAGVGFTVTELSNGFGRHRYYLSSEQFTTYRRMDYLYWAQLFIILPLSKVSICQFLLRLSTVKKTKLRTSLYALIGFVVVTHVPFIILILVQCRPAHIYWNSNADGDCFTSDRVADIVISQGAFSILTDFILAALPVIIVWNVQISTRTKISLCFLMGLGIITAAACIARTSLSWQLKAEDVTWIAVPNYLWRIAEVNIGIIAACTPHMKPLIRHLRGLSGEEPLTSLTPRSPQSSTSPRWCIPFRRSPSNARGWFHATSSDEFPSRRKRRESFHFMKKKPQGEEVAAEPAWDQGGWGLGDIRMTTDIYIREADGTGAHWPRRSADMPIVTMDMFGLGDQIEGNWRRKSMDKKSLAPDCETEGSSQIDDKKAQDVAHEGTWRRKSEDRRPDDSGDEIGGGGERRSTEHILPSPEQERRDVDSEDR